jgi:hypothetical protein
MTARETGDREPIPPRDDTEPLPPVAGGPPAPAGRWRAGRALAVAGGLCALLVVAALIANAAVARAAEERAAERAEAAVGGQVDVRLSGWPVGLRLLTGRPVDVRIRARAVPVPGSEAVVDLVELELDGVPVDFALLEEPAPELQAAAGRFVVELGDDAVQQLVGPVGRLPLVDIELRSGVARLNVARFPVIDATAGIEDGQVVFRPTAPIGTFAAVALRVAELPFGFEADDVEIRPGVLRLTGSASDVRLGEQVR